MYNQDSYKDYIKDGDGDRVYINRAGMRMFTTFLAKNKGVTNAAKIIGKSRQTLASLRDNSYCEPETWETVFNSITQQTAA